ncbi:hypothetical protein IPC85_23700 [Pseudomonas aeruginosa]|nr:hypothetical protein IPC85_23700 [Pseudomonas aeruginosa]RMK81533.1 hypothetical protein IPC84_19700 [Pseudomonas aeruginosa]
MVWRSLDQRIAVQINNPASLIAMVQLAKPAAARQSASIVSAQSVLHMFVTASKQGCDLCRSPTRACKVKNLLLQAWPRSRFRSLLQR